MYMDRVPSKIGCTVNLRYKESLYKESRVIRSLIGRNFDFWCETPIILVRPLV